MTDNFLRPKFLGLAVKRGENWTHSFCHDDDQTSNIIKWGIEDGIIPRVKSAEKTSFASDLSNFISGQEGYHEPIADWSQGKLTKTSYSYKIPEDKIQEQMEIDGMEKNSSYFRNHREPGGELKGFLNHPLIEEWIRDGRKSLWLGSQRPLNNIMRAGSEDFVAILRRVDENKFGIKNMFDFFVKHTFYLDEWSRRRSAIGQILEQSVLEGEVDFKICGIFCIDLTPEIRFLYHTEIDYGNACAEYPIEFKTAFYNSDDESDAVDYLNKDKGGIYRYKIPDMFCKANLSGIKTVVLAVAEDGNMGVECKTIRFYNTAKMDSNSARIRMETVYSKSLETFKDFLACKRFVLSENGKLFKIRFSKNNRQFSVELISDLNAEASVGFNEV